MRTAQRLLAEIVGPSLRSATTPITKTTRTQADDETPGAEKGQQGRAPDRIQASSASNQHGEIASVDLDRGADRGAKSRRTALSEWVEEVGRLTPAA